MITQKCVILLMHLCAPTILVAQSQPELGPELPLYRMYTCTLHLYTPYSVHEMTDTGRVSSLHYCYV